MKNDVDDILETLLGNEQKETHTPVAVATKTKNEQAVELKFITQDEYEKLGKPSVGYTTARIYKFAKHEKNSKEYYNVLLEYYRAAVNLCKLLSTIKWYEKVDEYELNLCRKEIEHFRTTNKLTSGDMGQLLQILYFNEYNRKKIVARLTDVARHAFEVNKDKKITLRELADVPPNNPPILKFVKENIVVEPINNLSVDDIIKSALGSNSCEEHPFFKGLRMPRSGCKVCLKIYETNKANGIKENRG